MRYQELTPSERTQVLQFFEGIFSDPEIMQMVDEHHSSGTKCAVIITMEDGEFQTGYVANDIAIRDAFRFEPISEALNTYDPADSVCMIFLRDGLVSASVGGRIE